MRLTHATKRVLQVLLDAPRPEVYGTELIVATGLESGTLYPILHRLESAGWVSSRWEKPSQATSGRQRRRYYRLTKSGRESARAATEPETVGLRVLSPGWSAP